MDLDPGPHYTVPRYSMMWTWIRVHIILYPGMTISIAVDPLSFLRIRLLSQCGSGSSFKNLVKNFLEEFAVVKKPQKDGPLVKKNREVGQNVLQNFNKLQL